MVYLHPIVLQASFHQHIWGGRRIERDLRKQLPPGDVRIGESWETEISNIAQNEPYKGKTLGTLVEELGAALLGEQAIAIFGNRFPLLAKFLDANDKLSVQVHPDDSYAKVYENGKLGKTEFWYILAAEPDASIVHGFKAATSCTEVRKALENVTLNDLLHEEPVSTGDIIFVPAGTVHAINGGMLFYELEEYSDITYRLYDYGRPTVGTSRQLNVERALAVSHFEKSPFIKVQPVLLSREQGYEKRCLVACRYFVSCEIILKQNANAHSYKKGKTAGSCIILTSLDAEGQVRYGNSFESSERLVRGQTMVLPAMLGNFCIEGAGRLLFSYVPAPEDEAWQLWEEKNREVR